MRFIKYEYSGAKPGESRWLVYKNVNIPFVTEILPDDIRAHNGVPGVCIRGDEDYAPIGDLMVGDIVKLEIPTVEIELYRLDEDNTPEPVWSNLSHIDSWLPITNEYCNSVDRSVFKFGAPVWRKEPMSGSCTYCGSMSTEELLNCMESLPRPRITISDKGNKLYIDRYPHAGYCILPYDNKTANGNSMSSPGCSHPPTITGGPIKYYMHHLWDGNRSETERKRIIDMVNKCLCEDSEAAERERTSQRENL